MTKLQEELYKLTAGISIGWSEPSIQQAYTILSWLKIDPNRIDSTIKKINGYHLNDLLSEEEIVYLFELILNQFNLYESHLTWSSYRLESLISALNDSHIEKALERFLKHLWKRLETLEPNPSIYEFCRALGNLILVKNKGDINFNWAFSPNNVSQACFSYWFSAASSSKISEEQINVIENLLLSCAFTL